MKLFNTDKFFINCSSFIILFLPINGYASDFTILFVALGSLLIVGIIIILGIISLFISRNKGHQKALPYIAAEFILMLIAIGLITDEARHMSDSDYKGLMAIVLLSGILAMLLPFFIKKKINDKDSTEEK